MPLTTVSLLGPLMVAVDGAHVEVPGRGERALLSLLALDVGRRVSVQRLVESLWEEDLPADPTNALQLRVSKLRRAVGDLVVTEPSGYRLDLPTTCIDIHRFRALVARRRPREALALWRGTPLAEFAGRRWADIELTALQQERVHATTDRIDADLEQGRHLELVGELERLVEEHPANERLWARFMLAQYRSDRPAAALGTFQRARNVLAEQFGLDPGPHLLKMERAILHQERTLDAPAARTTGTPAPLGRLVGRAGELERCLSALRSHRLVTVVGPGGVGKTRLALEAARDLADHETLTSWFRRRSCLLVLDGCEHAGRRRRPSGAAVALGGDRAVPRTGRRGRRWPGVRWRTGGGAIRRGPRRRRCDRGPGRPAAPGDRARCGVDTVTAGRRDREPARSGPHPAGAHQGTPAGEPHAARGGGAQPGPAGTGGRGGVPAARGVRGWVVAPGRRAGLPGRRGRRRDRRRAGAARGTVPGRLRARALPDARPGGGGGCCPPGSFRRTGHAATHARGALSRPRTYS